MKINGVLDETHQLPLLITPSHQGGIEELLNTYRKESELLKKLLLNHGALLFRGFGVDSPENLETLLSSLPLKSLPYIEGNSPRKKLKKGVYTSTEYPSHYPISLHNELSYCQKWPAYIFFCCATAPKQAGETPIANSHAILKGIDPNILQTFKAKKIRYIRNLHGGYGVGPSWQDSFETTSRTEVENHCRENDIEFVWKADEGLRLYQTRPATALHPELGIEVWFNQAHQFHASDLPKEEYEAIMSFFESDEENLPQNATFGDGSPIPLSHLEAIRQTLKDHTTAYSWEKGDLLMLDNMLACHGRNPFSGERKILVGMASS